MLEQLLVVLQPLSESPLDELRGRSQDSPPKPVKSRPTKSSPKVDKEVVEEFLRELGAVQGDGEALGAVLKKLRADKRVKLGEANAILSGARARDVRVAKKADALKEIEQWYQRRIDTVRRLKGAEDLY